jgi:signal transduction histidine kinase
MKLVKYFLTFIFIVQACFGQGKEILITNEKARLIGENLAYFVDQSEIESATSLISKLNQFKQNENPVFSKNARPGAIWFYFSVQNKTNQGIWMDIGNSNLTSIEFYKFDQQFNMLSQDKGGCLEQNQPFFKDNFTFIHPVLEPDEKELHHFLIRIETNLIFEVPIYLGSMSEILSNRNKFDYVSLLFIGAVALMFFYNLSIYMVVRDKIYLYYSLYLITVFVSGSYLNNFPIIELLLGKNIAHNYLDTFLWTVFVSIGLFTIQYFKLKQLDPFFYKVIWVFMLIFIGMGIANIFIPLVYIANIYTLLTVIYFVSCLILSYRLLHRGVKEARLFCIGWSFMMVGVILYVLVYEGFIYYNAFTRNISYIGSTIEILIFSIALGRRITNLKLAQDKLNNSLITKNQELNAINESLDSFNYHVSHDLKTVLNNTIALNRMIKKYNGLNDSKKVGEISEKLEKLAINGNETVQSFLSIGRIDSLLREDQNESIDVTDEIKKILEVNELTNKIDVEIRKQEFKSLRMHPKAFESVFLNLFTNSIKYNQKQPKAEIQFLIDGKILIIEYRDNGIGIDLNKYGSELFKPFIRAGYHEKQEGSGVGLYLIKRIVTSYGGSISVESELGKGTLFKITF